jgi:hypothetical protein
LATSFLLSTPAISNGAAPLSRFIISSLSSELEDCANETTALTIAGYNAVSRFLLAMDVAEMKDTKVGDARLPSAKL